MMIDVVAMQVLARLGFVRKGDGAVRHLACTYEACACNQFRLGWGVNLSSVTHKRVKKTHLQFWGHSNEVTSP